MDPYIEDQFWSSFHAQLCVEIARQLTPQLAGRYAALVEERAITESIGELSIVRRDIRPDVSVATRQRPVTSSATSLIERGPVQMQASYETSGRMHFVEIRSVRGLELITLIELLSPANKRGEGRNEYLTKRSDVLRSTVNLVEIDLLLSGQRVPMVEPYPESDYVAMLHRANDRPIADVWPIKLAETLPTIPIPLASGDTEVSLDLQHAVTTVLETTRLFDIIDYSLPLHAPLKPEELGWMDDRLRGAGLRQGSN
jgi:hypothetical protein